MNPLIEALPGLPMPFTGDQRLTDMWNQGVQSTKKPIETRASQLNLIIHFGLKTQRG